METISQTISQTIAKDLLKIKAVFFRPEEPSAWASGIKSPVCCDNRLLELFSIKIRPATGSLHDFPPNATANRWNCGA